MPRERLAVNRDSEDGFTAAGDPDDPAAGSLQGGCPRAKGTNGRFGGKVPSGNSAVRSPALSLSAASCSTSSREIARRSLSKKSRNPCGDVHLCDDGQPIDHELLSASLRGEPREDSAESRAGSDGDVSGDSEPSDGGPPMDPASWATRLADLDLAAVERSVIEEAIRRSGGNKSEAARRLGISRSAIGRKLARFGI